MKARCSGWSFSIVPSPSSVVMLPFAAADTGTEQERTDLPSISTVQAPHWASPQPNFGPFSSRSLRRTYRSGVSGATDDTRRAAPFTRNVKSAMIFSGRVLVLGRGKKAYTTGVTQASAGAPQCGAANREHHPLTTASRRPDRAMRSGCSSRPRGSLAAIELGAQALEPLRAQTLGVEAALLVFKAYAPSPTRASAKQTIAQNNGYS